MKPCPFCAEPIQPAAIKCRWCGEFLDERQPTPAGPPRARIVSGALRRSVADHFRDVAAPDPAAVLAGTCVHCRTGVTFLELSGTDCAKILARSALGLGVGGILRSLGAAAISGTTAETRKCPACSGYVDVCPDCLTIHPTKATDAGHACMECGASLV